MEAGVNGANGQLPTVMLVVVKGRENVTIPLLPMADHSVMEGQWKMLLAQQNAEVNSMKSSFFPFSKTCLIFRDW